MNNRSTSSTQVRQPFLWLGEQLALDFLNTEPNVRGQRVELLDSFESLVKWCTEAELVTNRVAKDILRRWAATRDAARTLDNARRLRHALRLALERRQRGARSWAPTLEAVNACLRLEGISTEAIVGSGRRFERRLHFDVKKPDQLLRPIADAAVELLCDLDPALVRRCDDAECVLHFHDVSKNHARRWCSMALCGNRTKVAAHHARQRAKKRP